MELNHTEGSTQLWKPLQFREHDLYASYNPDFSFTKPDTQHVQVASGTTSMGTGYLFFTVDAEWIDDKYLRVYWRDQSSQGTIYCRLWDGSYDRSSMVDFPDEASRISKGNGDIQTIRSITGGNTETFDVQIDSSGASLSVNTIAFQVQDSWNSQTKNLDVYWIEINSGAGGTGNLVTWNINADVSITMEQSGTLHDYGRADGGSIVDFGEGGYSTSGYFNTSDAMSYLNGSCLTLLVNSTIPESTTLKTQFSSDGGITWVDSQGNAGGDSLSGGHEALDLRDLNHTSLTTRFNFTGLPAETPRLYQFRLISTEDGGLDTETSPPSESDAPWIAIAIILMCVGILLARSK